jgi:hypothetical protein
MGAFMKFTFPVMAAALAMSIASGSAQGQSNIKPRAAGHIATSLVTSVTEADLRELVIVEGDTVDEMHPFEAPSVRGKTKDGHLFVLVGTACDKNGVKGCQGIMMQVRYDADDRVTLEGMNSANLKEAALSSWWDKSDKTIGFTRYVVLDDGVTWMNIRQNLRVLLSIEPTAMAQIWPD